MDREEIARLTALEGRHWWYSERRVLIRRWARESDGRTAIDIGAAGGGNTRVLRDLGWAAFAVEYDADAAAVAATRGVPAVRGDARRLPVADGCVDVVIAFDLLEHVEDDLAVTREIRRVLRPDGRALVAVPADPKLWSEHDHAVGHVRRYTRETLTAVLEGAGLGIESMASWNVLLRPAVAVRRRRSHGSDLDDPATVLNWLLRGVVAAERFLPGLDRLPGVSLLAAVRPQAVPAKQARVLPPS